MYSPIEQKSLTLLLSTLALAWGTVPPGVRHAHTGGSDSTHQHADRHHVAHHGSNSPAHGHVIEPGVSLQSGFVVHLHVQWLGIKFSMPVAEEPNNGRADPDLVPPVLVCSADRGVPAAPSFGRVPWDVLGMPNHDVVQEPLLLPHGLSLTGSIPLCDSARFERSGVLLA